MSYPDWWDCHDPDQTPLPEGWQPYGASTLAEEMEAMTDE